MREKALLAIEANLSKAFVAEYEDKVDAVAVAYSEAMGRKDYEAARQIAQSLDFQAVADALEGRLEFYGLAALFFGVGTASDVPTEESGTAQAGKPEIITPATRQAKNMVVDCVQAVRDTLIKLADDAEAGLVVEQKASKRVIQDFTSDAYAKASGKSRSQLQTIASLHSTRLAGWGFLNEASFMGVKVYEINEVLDSRTCGVCYEMHGKRFYVQDTYSKLDGLLRVDDPDQLKELSPWPKNSKAGLETLRGMGEKDLVANGWTHPPFHPFCRGLLTHVGTSPSMDAPAQELDNLLDTATDMDGRPLVDGPDSNTRLATEDDFVETRNAVTAGDVTNYNALFDGRILPRDLLDGLTGPLRPAGDSVSPVMIVRKDEVSISYSQSGVGAISRTIERTSDGKLHAYHETLRLDTPAPETMRAVLASSMAMYEQAGVDVIDMQANIDVGGYAWARYGFAPNAGSWSGMKSSIRDRVDRLESEALIGVAVADYVRELLTRSEPKTIWQIADLRTPVEATGVALGRELLVGLQWLGSLSLSDSDARERFEAFMGSQS